MKIDMNLLNERPLSFSSLSKFAISPLHYLSYLTQPKEVTPALIIGKAVHASILQPSEFARCYAVQPQADGRTKEGKEIKVEFQKANQGKTILTPDQADLVMNITESVNNHPHAFELLSACTWKETKICFEIGGLPFISYLDGISPNCILEIKTTERADANSFGRDAYNFKYHLQAAIYSQATGLNSVKYIVIEKSAPYAINIFQADEDYLEAGQRLLKRLTAEFKSCMDQDNFWKGYEYWRFSKEESLILPAWALKNQV